MPSTFIAFDGWAPGGAYFGEGWGTVSNLYPAYGDWRPWRKFNPKAAQVADGLMIGTHVHLWPSGIGSSTYVPDAQTLFCGSTSGHLYTVDPAAGTFVDVSRAALYSSTAAGYRFASVGNDIWAANGVNVLQRRTNNAGLFADGAVSTLKPQPRFLKTVREHLVGANLSNAGDFPDTVRWSDADDATNWDPAVGTSTSLAASKRLVSIPGQITGLLGGQYALAFKRRCIYYLEYTGDVQVFRPDVLSTNVGTGFPSSIIDSRYGTFFLGPDGFYSISGLSEPQKISTPGIDYFLFNSPFTANVFSNISMWQEDVQAIGFQFPGWPIVGWALNTTWQGGCYFALLFNPVTNQWTRVDIANQPTETGDLRRVTGFFERPFAESLYDMLSALLSTVLFTNYAPLANDSAVTASPSLVKAPLLQMNFRPANFDTATRQGQSKVNSILPMFSGAGGVSSTALTYSVTVDALLDPASGIWKTETRLASERDAVSGAYPFQISGRLFRVTINCAPEDFANFEGLFVDQELLT